MQFHFKLFLEDLEVAFLKIAPEWEGLEKVGSHFLWETNGQTAKVGLAVWPDPRSTKQSQTICWIFGATTQIQRTGAMLKSYSIMVICWFPSPKGLPDLIPHFFGPWISIVFEEVSKFRTLMLSH